MENQNSSLQLELVQQSINHWQLNLTNCPNIDISGYSCPLCIQYSNQCCKGCPIAEDTKQELCYGTPYHELHREYHKQQNRGANKLKILVKEELEYLKALYNKLLLKQ